MGVPRSWRGGPTRPGVARTRLRWGPWSCVWFCELCAVACPRICFLVCVSRPPRRPPFVLFAGVPSSLRSKPGISPLVCACHNLVDACFPHDYSIFPLLSMSLRVTYHVTAARAFSRPSFRLIVVANFFSFSARAPRARRVPVVVCCCCRCAVCARLRAPRVAPLKVLQHGRHLWRPRECARVRRQPASSPRAQEAVLRLKAAFRRRV